MLNNYLLNDTDWQKRKLDGLFVSVGVEENRHFRVLLVSVNWNYLFGEWFGKSHQKFKKALYPAIQLPNIYSIDIHVQTHNSRCSWHHYFNNRSLDFTYCPSTGAWLNNILSSMWLHNTHLLKRWGKTTYVLLRTHLHDVLSETGGGQKYVEYAADWVKRE